MIRIVFKNLATSNLVREAVEDRVSKVFARFPDLVHSRVAVILSMENSPHQAGRDSFTVKIIIRGGRYKDIILQKSAQNLYVALADVVDHLLERLNRFGDRVRVRRRRQLRRDQERFFDGSDEETNEPKSS